MVQGCGAWRAAESRKIVLPPASPLPPDIEASEGAIRFLEARVKRDPDDFTAHNKLAGYYLQRLRETGNLDYLNLARRTADASLKAIPAEQNAGGLALLAQTEFAAHNFVGARDHAGQLVKLEPRKSYPYQLLGDALLELGAYDEAKRAFREMERRDASSVGTWVRLGRLAMLEGRTEASRKHFQDALVLAADAAPPSRETLAWCRWQLGELEFSLGAYEAAEGYYRESLVTFPDYYRALAGLGRVRAARGATEEAITHYERAVRIIPEPSFLAALGDLYQINGRKSDAEAQFALVEQIARLNAAGGSVYNRQLALFYADHDLKPEEGYQLAKREYEARRDVYGADALAWTAFKAGHIAEARSAIKDAMRLGTEDARLLYHAGMISRAGADRIAARDYLERALKVSPQFDPRQAPIAAKALSE